MADPEKALVVAAIVEGRSKRLERMQAEGKKLKYRQ
jgi:hypothetical protein